MDQQILEEKYKYVQKRKISNRVMSIDMNPNYIGWSIINWKTESDFNIIKSGVISIKN